jgi:hypothetical protein
MMLGDCSAIGLRQALGGLRQKGDDDCARLVAGEFFTADSACDEPGEQVVGIVHGGEVTSRVQLAQEATKRSR